MCLHDSFSSDCKLISLEIQTQRINCSSIFTSALVWMPCFHWQCVKTSQRNSTLVSAATNRPRTAQAIEMNGFHSTAHAASLCERAFSQQLLSNIFISFLKACANAIRATIIFPNLSKSFINLLSTKRSTEVFLWVSAKIKAPSTVINVSIIIVMLFCKIK